MAPAYHVIAFELEVLYLPSAPEGMVENENLPGREFWRKTKEKEASHNCMATVDQKVSKYEQRFLILNFVSAREY